MAESVTEVEMSALAGFKWVGFNDFRFDRDVMGNEVGQIIDVALAGSADIALKLREPVGVADDVMLDAFCEAAAKVGRFINRRSSSGLGTRSDRLGEPSRAPACRRLRPRAWPDFSS